MGWFNRLVRETVVIHTTDGGSLRGVLMEVHRDCLILAHAMYLAGDQQTPVDGEAIVPRERVSWLQRLGGAQ